MYNSRQKPITTHNTKKGPNDQNHPRNDFFHRREILRSEFPTVKEAYLASSIQQIKLLLKCILLIFLIFLQYLKYTSNLYVAVYRTL